MTSDLSIDEELNLHSVAWEPVEMAFGISVFSVPVGVWTWGSGEISSASQAHAYAFSGALARLHADAQRAGAHGVVGVGVERKISSHSIEVALTGTAIRPVGARPIDGSKIFVSDLSAKDFARLVVAGWMPVGFAHGASFVYAPRRSMGTVLSQQNQNVELTNYTAALYTARENAMERMQASALSLGGQGVVEVKVDEGPMAFASHAVCFSAWGTVVTLASGSHQHLEPITTVSLNDATVVFNATTLGE